MRLAVIADVHGNLPALEAVLARVRTQAVDLVVNLGDHCTGPLWPAETLALLRASDVCAIRGNHDRWLAEGPPRPSRLVALTRDALDDEARAHLGALPATRTIAPDVLAVHGTPDSDTAYLLEDDVDQRLALATRATLDARLGDVAASLVLCAHSHHQHVAHASRGRLVLNPGSVGCPRAAGNADALRNEASTPHARFAVVTRTGRTWGVACHAVAYDWTRAERRARALGEDAWADAFVGGA